MRGEPALGTETVQANAYLQENGTNNKLAKQYQLVDKPTGSTSQRKLRLENLLASGGYKFVIHAGFAEQVLEIGGLANPKLWSPWSSVV